MKKFMFLICAAAALFFAGCGDPLREAAEKGDANAQYDLAMCYQYGDGVEQNRSEAFTLFRKASRQGYPGKQKEELPVLRSI